MRTSRYARFSRSSLIILACTASIALASCGRNANQPGAGTTDATSGAASAPGAMPASAPMAGGSSPG
jgi:hypothetical protein